MKEILPDKDGVYTDFAYSLNGDEFSLISKVVELTKAGYIVDPHTSCKCGIGSYLISYTKPKEEKKEIPSPDWEHAKSLIACLSDEEATADQKKDAKTALKEYAAEFGVEIDTRKKDLIAHFQGKFGQVKKKA